MSRASFCRPTMSSASSDQGSSARRRRGRQPRPCMLTSSVRSAAAQFAQEVGAPRVIEPAGFRDFVGWLQYLASSHAAESWVRLVRTVVTDCEGDLDAVASIQPDIIREIIANVITIQPGESSKLISTNARRQSARPAQGLTLMKIFDDALASTDSRNRGDSQRRGSSSRRTGRNGSHRTHSSGHEAGSSSSRPPMASPEYREETLTVRLPSMQELDESLRRRGSSSRGSSSRGGSSR